MSKIYNIDQGFMKVISNILYHCRQFDCKGRFVTWGQFVFWGRGVYKDAELEKIFGSKMAVKRAVEAGTLPLQAQSFAIALILSALFALTKYSAPLRLKSTQSNSNVILWSALYLKFYILKRNLAS